MCAIWDFYDFSGASRFHKKHRKNRVPNVHTFECKDNEITKWLQSSIQGHRTYTKTFIDYNVLGPKMSWEQFYWQGCGHSAFSGQDLSHNSYANRKYLKKSLIVLRNLENNRVFRLTYDIILKSVKYGPKWCFRHKRHKILFLCTISTIIVDFVCFPRVFAWKEYFSVKNVKKLLKKSQKYWFSVIKKLFLPPTHKYTWKIHP